MLPIRDYPHSVKTPIMTIALIVVNVAIFIYQSTIPNLEVFIAEYALTAAAVDFTSIQTLYPFVTSQFLHGDWMHLIMNMWFLWIFGDNIEENLGRLGYVTFYLLGGVAAALLQYFFDTTSIIPMLGASGAISAILGYYLVRFPHHKVQTFFYFSSVYLPAGLFLGLWFLIQITSGIGSLGIGGDTGGVAWWAHIGGFVFGVIIAKLLETKVPTGKHRYIEYHG